MNDHGLRVEVLTKDIVVTLPGTSYTVAYYKPGNSAQLRIFHIRRPPNPTLL